MGDEWADDGGAMSATELRELERTLLALDKEDLSDWDRTFVDDTVARVAKYGQRTVLTGKQTEQLERMKGQYL